MDLSKASVQGILDRVESICELLEIHERSVYEFFERNDHRERKSPIRSIDTELPRCVELLADIFDSLSSQTARRAAEGMWLARCARKPL